jgi:alkanesulfonate monooxygenase SsuD/methylene tetrahydromethanopterin reductase-like flavin-dependent oxidoreductase (luciferase family)
VTEQQMVLAIQIANGYGAQPGAWRMPGVDPSGYTDMDVLVRYARAAERGKIQLVFLADTPALTADLEREAPQHAVDPLVVLTSMARGTSRIGLVATGSTTFNDPYTIARQFKAPIPPSEQGQPVVFQAGGGANGLEPAARYASGVYANPYSIEEGRAHRLALREAAERAGRDPDEIKLFAGFMPGVAADRRAALDRRRRLDESIDLDQRVIHLGAMLGLRLDPAQLEQPLTGRQLAGARADPSDPRSARALAVARKGWTLHDVLAHGVIDYHPVVPGTATEVADHMQRWFDAGACDGFSLAIDVYHDGIDAFVDQVIPILQERGIFHRDYEGPTLRDHLGAPGQYGLDPRLAA